MADVRCIAPTGLKNDGKPSVYRGLSPTAKIYRPKGGFIEAAKNNFLKDRTRPQFSCDATGITRIVHGIFNPLDYSVKKGSNSTLLCKKMMQESHSCQLFCFIV